MFNNFNLKMSYIMNHKLLFMNQSDNIWYQLQKNNFELPIKTFKFSSQIFIKKCIKLNEFSNQNEILKNEIYFIGPLGKIKIQLNNAYITHTKHSLTINIQYLTSQEISWIKHLNIGLIAGFRKKLFQSGIWTIMKKSHHWSIQNFIQSNFIKEHKIKKKQITKLKFKLGLSYLTPFTIPKYLLFHSKRSGQFRTINLFSILYQLVTDTAAKFIKLKRADPYRLNGFRYALSPIYILTGIAPQHNLASGSKATNIKIKTAKK